MGRKRKRYISLLVCPGCSKTMYVPRRVNRQRPLGHEKTMRCPYCQRMQDFVEYREFMKDGNGEELFEIMSDDEE